MVLSEDSEAETYDAVVAERDRLRRRIETLEAQNRAARAALADG